MTPNPKNIGAAPEEYPIRALVRADAGTLPSLGWPAPGSIIMVRQGESGEMFDNPNRYYSFDELEPKIPFPFRPEEIIIDPTPEQIAEERAKAGLPPQEGEALPEPQAKGPSPSEVPQPGEGVDLEAMRKALEAAEHELTTLHGLTATDDPHAYSEALSEGLDTNGAADCARESTWVIDTSKTRAIIRAALGKAGA